MIYAYEHLIMLAPAFLEVGLDNLMWKLGLDDKPLSTWVARPIFFVLASWLVVRLNGQEWWQVLGVIGFYHLLFFPYLINWSLGRKFFYLSDKNPFDRLLKRAPNYPRLWLQIMLAIVVVCVYYYY